MSNAETRLHFRIGYLGDSYHGSQIQPDVVTVQGELVRVFQTLGWISKTEEEHNLVLSSRTDAGVHVRVNGGTVRISSELWKSITPRKFIRAVDDLLPHDIAFLDVREVGFDCHDMNRRDSQFENADVFLHWTLSSPQSSLARTSMASSGVNPSPPTAQIRACLSQG